MHLPVIMYIKLIKKQTHLSYFCRPFLFPVFISSFLFEGLDILANGWSVSSMSRRRSWIVPPNITRGTILSNFTAAKFPRREIWTPHVGGQDTRNPASTK